MVGARCEKRLSLFSSRRGCEMNTVISAAVGAYLAALSPAAPIEGEKVCLPAVKDFCVPVVVGE